MRKIYFLVVISVMTMFSKGYSIDNTNKYGNSYGYQKYGKETVDVIQGNGSVYVVFK